jgi:hypothetical protein
LCFWFIWYLFFELLTFDIFEGTDVPIYTNCFDYARELGAEVAWNPEREYSAVPEFEEYMEIILGTPEERVPFWPIYFIDYITGDFYLEGCVRNPLEDLMFDAWWEYSEALRKELIIKHYAELFVEIEIEIERTELLAMGNERAYAEQWMRTINRFFEAVEEFEALQGESQEETLRRREAARKNEFRVDF